MSYGGFHVARGILSPNPGLRLGASQLTAVIHEGEAFEMEWREPDTGRLHNAVVRPGSVHIHPADRPFYQRWSGQPKVMVMAFDLAGDRIRRIWAVLNPEKLRPWTTG